MFKRKVKGKKGIAVAVIILFATILCLVVFSAFDNVNSAEVYNDAVEKICADEYDDAYNELSEITDYKDAEKVAKYALIVRNFNEKDYKNYEYTLGQLNAIKPFENSDLNDNLKKFKEKINTLIKQRDSDYAKAKALEKEIDGLVNVDLSDKEKVISLQRQYDESSDIVRINIKNISKLQKANEKIESIEKSVREAKAAEEKIKAIGTVSLSSKPAIESARSIYNSLSPDAKQYVESINVLVKAENDYDKLLEKEEAEKTRAAVATTKKRSSGNSSKTHKNHTATVYWVANGGVYHISEDCPTLKRSKKIYSGTVYQSGKSRACKVCS